MDTRRECNRFYLTDRCLKKQQDGKCPGPGKGYYCSKRHIEQKEVNNGDATARG